MCCCSSPPPPPPQQQQQQSTPLVIHPQTPSQSSSCARSRRILLMILMMMMAGKRDGDDDQKDDEQKQPHRYRVRQLFRAGGRKNRQPFQRQQQQRGCNASISFSSSSSSSRSTMIRMTSSLLIVIAVMSHQYECVSGQQESANQQNPSTSSSGTIDPRVITYPGDVNFALIIDAHENVNRRPVSPSAAPGSPSFSTLNINSTTKPTSYGPLDCSERINSDGVLKGMAAIWAAHQVNIRKGKGERLKIGVSVYDSCSSAQVIQRQSVRLVASSVFSSSPSGSTSSSSSSPHHLLPSLKNCRDTAASKTQPLIFGVVIDVDSEEVATPALSLFDSFSVPVVTTSQINQETINNNETIIDSSIFSVAPSLEYMSKGVMSLLKRLNWASATLVISDQVPPSYSSVFEEIAKTVNFNVIATNPIRVKVRDGRNLRRRNTLHEFSIPESVKNTLLFLSTKESLQLFNSLKSNLPLPGNDKYNWILVTDSDITDKVRGIFSRNNSSSSNSCHTKSMFLLVPNTNVPTKEFNKTYASNSVHPLISQFSKQYLSPDPVNKSSSDSLQLLRSGSSGSTGHVKRKKLIITSSEGLSLTMKSVWTMAIALKKIEDHHCVPGNLSKVECIETLKGLGLRELILNQTRDLSYEKLPGLGVASMEGLPLKFNPQNILKTSKFMLKIVTSTCKVFDAGYYMEDGGLVVNEVIFNTLKVESEATSSSAPSGTYKAASSYYTLNPALNRMNRSITSLRSLKPQLIGGSSVGLMFPGIDNSSRAAVSERFENEPEDSVNDSLNVTFTTLMENNNNNGGGGGKNSRVEYTSTNPAGSRSPGDHVTSYTGENAAKMATSRSPASSSTEAKQQQHHSHPSGSRESLSNLKRFRNVIRMSGSSHTMSLTSWLGRGWSMTILISSVIGSLVTLYTFTFLLMKFCELEGSSVGGSNKQASVSLTLFACMSLFLGSMLFLFEPTPSLCTIKSSVHNIGLCLLFGSLLIQSMYLRAHKSLGLGGNVSQVNQLLTLGFIVATQISIESSSWKILIEWSHSNIFTYSVYAMCAPSSQEFLLHQSFIICLLVLLILYSWSSRNEPMTSNDGANLLTSVALICPVYISSIVLCEYFTDSALDDVSRGSTSNRDIISATSMILIAFICLIVIFVPIMYTIHKYDSSLSTSAFTMFHRSAGMTNINPIGISHHHLSTSSGGGDHRPILDNLSTSSTSTNNDSYLGAGVSSNPTSRLLLGANMTGAKGRKKNKDSGKQHQLHPAAVNASGSSSKLLLSHGLSKSGHHSQAIFSPQTASYHYACNSPNCNFKMQHPVSSATSASSNSRRFLSPPGAATMHHQINNPMSRSSSYPPTSTTAAASYSPPAHLTPAAAATSSSSRFGFQSLFRPDGMLTTTVPFSRFHSMHTLAKESEHPPTTNSTYHRLNPLFEQTEGSFRSAYP